MVWDFRNSTLNHSTTPASEKTLIFHYTLPFSSTEPDSELFTGIVHLLTAVLEAYTPAHWRKDPATNLVLWDHCLFVFVFSLYKVDVSFGELGLWWPEQDYKIIGTWPKLLVTVHFPPRASPYHLDLILSPDCAARGPHLLSYTLKGS